MKRVHSGILLVILALLLTGCQSFKGGESVTQDQWEPDVTSQSE
jgi:hypothetical protein